MDFTEQNNRREFIRDTAREMMVARAGGAVVRPPVDEIAKAAVVEKTRLTQAATNQQKAKREFSGFCAELNKLVAASEGRFEYNVSYGVRKPPFLLANSGYRAITLRTNIKNETEGTHIAEHVMILCSFYDGNNMGVISTLRRHASDQNGNFVFEGATPVLAETTRAAIDQGLVDPIKGEKILAALRAKPTAPEAAVQTKPSSQSAQPQQPPRPVL